MIPPDSAWDSMPLAHFFNTTIGLLQENPVGMRKSDAMESLQANFQAAP